MTRTRLHVCFAEVLGFILTVVFLPAAIPNAGRACEEQISQIEILSMLREGKFAALDKKLDGYQQTFETTGRRELNVTCAYSSFFTTDPRTGIAIQRWLKAEPNSIPAHIARGAYFTHIGWAVRSDDSAMDTHPESMAEMQDMHRRATRDFAWALERNPRLTFATSELMLLALWSGNEEATDRLYAEGLATSPNSVRLRAVYADTLRPWWRSESARSILGRLRELMAQIESRFNDDPDFAWSRGYLEELQGRMLIREGEFAGAIDYFNQALTFREIPSAYLGRANARLKMGDKAAGLADLKRVEELLGNLRCGSAELARLYQNIGDYEKALAHLDKLAACDPLKPDIIGERAYVRFLAGHAEDAVHDINMALIYGSHSPRIRFIRGAIYDEIDRITALNEYRLAAQYSPHDISHMETYIHRLINRSECEALTAIPLYLSMCDAGAKCSYSSEQMYGRLYTSLIHPCGAEQGPPEKKTLPMPDDGDPR
jgi:tetratricopeptide (TPR) repeat protein